LFSPRCGIANPNLLGQETNDGTYDKTRQHDLQIIGADGYAMEKSGDAGGLETVKTRIAELQAQFLLLRDTIKQESDPTP